MDQRTKATTATGSVAEAGQGGIFFAIVGVAAGYVAVALGAAGEAPEGGYFDGAHALVAWVVGFMAPTPVILLVDVVPALRRRQDQVTWVLLGLWVVAPAALVVVGAGDLSTRSTIVLIGAALLVVSVLLVLALILFGAARQRWRRRWPG